MAEYVIHLDNGRELRCPAYPAECEYVRITERGRELYYWDWREWQRAPKEVIGAIFGATNLEEVP